MADLSDDMVTYGPDFLANGYLVAVPWDPARPHLHDGISDCPFPIDSDSPGQWEKLRQELGVPRSFDGVHVATNWPATLSYFHRCRQLHLDGRLQLIRTRYTRPRVNPPEGC